MERLTKLWIMPRHLAIRKGTATQFALGLLPVRKLDTNGTGLHGTPVLTWYLQSAALP